MTAVANQYYVQPQAYGQNNFSVQPQAYQPSGFSVTSMAYTSPAQAFGAMARPALNWINQNVMRPVQQFQQEHPYASAAIGGAAGGVAAMSSGCAYCGMSVAAPMMGEAIQQGGQYIQETAQQVGQKINGWFVGNNH